MSRLIESGTTDGVGFGSADETDAPLNVAGEFNVAGTLNLDQALGISGVVLDDSQAGIQDATVGVTLTENGNDVIYETTDANGAYSFTEHPDGDSTKQEWHVTAALNDAGDLFNAESKPFVRATLTPTIIQATGGDVVEDVTLNGADYRIHAFTTVGSQTFEVTNAPAQNNTVDVLLVGGGGGGGGSSGGDEGAGGGGAGEVRFFSESVDEQPYAITVGDGGQAGDTSQADDGDDGSATQAFAMTANGGFGGFGCPDDTDPELRFGGDYGGAGNDGAIGSEDGGGGGGGAGGPGSSPTTDDQDGGDGGIGVDESNRFGSSFGDNGFFGGGGGGGIGDEDNPTDRGEGGVGGGGSGGFESSPDAENGLTNTGGGGGGAAQSGEPAGDGGSGIVLIRYEI